MPLGAIHWRPAPAAHRARKNKVRLRARARSLVEAEAEAQDAVVFDADVGGDDDVALFLAHAGNEAAAGRTEDVDDGAIGGAEGYAGGEVAAGADAEEELV